MFTILYVEDNPQNMRLVCKMLGVEGYSVIEAPTGYAGLELVKLRRPNLVLMDINLPDIDGMQVTQKIKSSPLLAHIPVIALTANAMHGDKERYIAAGCDGYLAKPVTRLELVKAIMQFLGQRVG